MIKINQKFNRLNFKPSTFKWTGFLLLAILLVVIGLTVAGCSNTNGGGDSGDQTVSKRSLINFFDANNVSYTDGEKSFILNYEHKFNEPLSGQQQTLIKKHHYNSNETTKIFENNLIGILDSSNKFEMLLESTHPKQANHFYNKWIPTIKSFPGKNYQKVLGFVKEILPTTESINQGALGITYNCGVGWQTDTTNNAMVCTTAKVGSGQRYFAFPITLNLIDNNLDQFFSETNYVQLMAQMYNMTWFSSNSEYTVIIHELGHALDYYDSLSSQAKTTTTCGTDPNDCFNQAFATTGDWFTPRTNPDLNNYLLGGEVGLINTISNDEGNFNRLTNMQKNDILFSLVDSDYARKSYYVTRTAGYTAGLAEWFAEAYAKWIVGATGLGNSDTVLTKGWAILDDFFNS